jgi:hypothetical protein
VTPRGESSWADRVAASWAAASAGAATVLWIAVWWHQQHTHGTTSVNEMKLALGLTWMDSGKVLPLAFLLLAPGVALVTNRAGKARVQAAFLTGRVVLALLAALAVSTVLEFWPFTWGSYAETFESRGGLVLVGGFLQAMCSAVVAVAVIVLGLVSRRTVVLPVWLALALAAGFAATFFITPVFLVPAVAWLVFALWLWPGRPWPGRPWPRRSVST